MIRQLCAAFLLLFFVSAQSEAVLVLGGPTQVLNGALGFGNAPPVLTLSSTPNESGEVSWDGSQDIFIGDADTNKSETVTAGTINANFSGRSEFSSTSMKAEVHHAR